MGPMGQGPQTGRGAGYCSGNTTPGAATAGGRGSGGGRGRGGGGGKGRGRHGHRNMFYATGLTGWQRAAAEEQTPPEPVSTATPVPVEPNEVAVLTEQAAELSRTLQQIQERLALLEGKAEQPVATESPDG